ncbi:DUF2513 domain-containing protein [Pseudomonas sp. St316]|uniref:DUF2513 domain-containing protein n=1 Tax=Pseudomonas sp. St316 TaxID=2678257 RepID=UPI001BB2F77D|nr:DUF2513 domain-containing protein [Pseudomonas sp. St316]BBP58506.1 hypothetical protein PHLH4_20960 [Pseudomonas sp. St316]
MKRDLDLVREILIHYEEKDNDAMDKELSLDGHAQSKINYHLLLMDEAGLLRCEKTYSSTTPTRVIKVYPFSMTWKGHEFLDAARDNKVWAKAKSVCVEKSGVLTFEIVKDLLILMAKDKLGLPQ